MCFSIYICTFRNFCPSKDDLKNSHSQEEMNRKTNIPHYRNRGKLETPITQMQSRSISKLDTGTSITSGGLKQSSWAQTKLIITVKIIEQVST
jgi:hypothetical protein